MDSAVTQHPALHLGCLVGGEVVQDHVDVEFCGDLTVDLVQKGDEVVLGVAFSDVGDDVPRAMSSAAKRSTVPLRT
jgi:hypothetical protein